MFVVQCEAIEGAEDWTWDKFGEDPIDGNGNGDDGKDDIEVIT
jgi:hypothetical protein